MSFDLKENPADSEPIEPGTEAISGEYRVTAEPIVQARSRPAAAGLAGELPDSYRTQTLTLLPSEPRTVFAYWDIDWERAFAGEPPRDRQVHLRVRTAEGANETSIAVEPMAGYCYFHVADGDVTYVGEIGYFEPAGVWNIVASSDAVTTPSDTVTHAIPEFATIPFHVNFQRLVDHLRIAVHDEESLTALLARLQRRADSAEERAKFTADEQDIAAAVGQATGEQPHKVPGDGSVSRDLWATQMGEGIPGFSSTSPMRGFGGSSRAN